MRLACDRFDRSLGWDSDDGALDLREQCFDRIFSEGEAVLTTMPDGFGCEHMQIWSANLAGPPTLGCGCDPRPLWQSTKYNQNAPKP